MRRVQLGIHGPGVSQQPVQEVVVEVQEKARNHCLPTRMPPLGVWVNAVAQQLLLLPRGCGCQSRRGEGTPIRCQVRTG